MPDDAARRKVNVPPMRLAHTLEKWRQHEKPVG
jgi:hypothetical protein